ncbi:MAG: ferrochelatase [Gammaproteobacteria bacterium]|nr:ferrochelatase [Gammaproteobacteria bacterium]
MSRYLGRADFRHGQAPRTGVLLVNLGTPDAPTTAAVRRYLAEFLADPRVVELPRWLWLPLLHGIILRTRPRRSAHAYQAIWGADGSPLLRTSERLRDALAATLRDGHGETVEVALGMRYGRPSIAAALDGLLAAEARRILVVPLYPQYAAATTASVNDAVFAALARRRWVPELRTIADYHADPRYIEALAASAESHWAAHPRGERLLLSFHGIPHDTFLAGDPYHCQCHATARLLATRLALADDAWQLSFQSRVGPKRWLEPYTDQTLRAWGAAGVGDIDVMCPGFAVDCLETLEEIALQNAATFKDAGGGTLRYIPALNDSAAHVEALAGIVGDHLAGWTYPPDAVTAAARAGVAARARDLGGQ